MSVTTDCPMKHRRSIILNHQRSSKAKRFCIAICAKCVYTHPTKTMPGVSGSQLLVSGFSVTTGTRRCEFASSLAKLVVARLQLGSGVVRF